ncbi:MAG: UDP-N-acetylmuramoyl-L-alanine--D-glutamate ligase [Candidatus Saganbacteria bacterium]|nr:UDP-N-acetylmuramoyl-L-alanine--D-glutamate ligase [Candidatus Saganbacteria bacterium]
MDYINKKISIIGFGKSGQAAAKRLLQSGAVVKVSESGKAASLMDWMKDIQFEYGGHTFDFIKDSDLIVVSPGVHIDIPAIEEAKKAGIAVISEVELAFSFFSKPVIAVTGTNGKTTTTTLIGEIFRKAGYRVAVAGNIGDPLSEVDDKDLDFIIAEISSYQLEAIEKFRPQIAVLLNVTPDHLERYKTMEAYTAAKEKIFENQVPGDYLVFNHDDITVRKMADKASSRKYPFSREVAVEGGLFVNDGYIVRLKENYLEAVIKLEDIKIKGSHNVENCLAVAAASLICGISCADIEKTMKEFPGVEHRIEHVRTLKGIEFYNDSKATNPDSTIVALKTLSKGGELVLILGGRDKGTDLKPMCSVILNTAKKVILIGEAAKRFEEELRASGFTDIEKASSMEEAVRISFERSKDGGIVLLSPACASFDMFKDYEDRGRAFKKSVMEIGI